MNNAIKKYKPKGAASNANLRQPLFGDIQNGELVFSFSRIFVACHSRKSKYLTKICLIFSSSIPNSNKMTATLLASFNITMKFLSSSVIIQHLFNSKIKGAQPKPRPETRKLRLLSHN